MEVLCLDCYRMTDLEVREREFYYKYYRAIDEDGEVDWDSSYSGDADCEDLVVCCSDCGKVNNFFEVDGDVLLYFDKGGCYWSFSDLLDDDVFNQDDVSEENKWKEFYYRTQDPTLLPSNFVAEMLLRAGEITLVGLEHSNVPIHGDIN